MTYREIKKGDWIYNTKCRDPKSYCRKPWYVNSKWNGFVLIRRRPKVGKLVALAPGQLRIFAKAYRTFIGDA